LYIRPFRTDRPPGALHHISFCHNHFFLETYCLIIHWTTIAPLFLICILLGVAGSVFVPYLLHCVSRVDRDAAHTTFTSRLLYSYMRRHVRLPVIPNFLACGGLVDNTCGCVVMWMGYQLYRVGLRAWIEGIIGISIIRCYVFVGSGLHTQEPCNCVSQRRASS